MTDLRVQHPYPWRVVGTSYDQNGNRLLIIRDRFDNSVGDGVWPESKLIGYVSL